MGSKEKEAADCRGGNDIATTITVSYIGHKLDIWKEKIRALTKLPLKKPQVPCERISAAVGSKVFKNISFLHRRHLSIWLDII